MGELQEIQFTSLVLSSSLLSISFNLSHFNFHRIMAESLVSGVLGQLASITMKELRLAKDAVKSISSLRKKLKDIQAVLEDAERKQLDDARIRRWLDELTDVSYDIDDVLDKWSSETLKSEIHKRVEAEENGHRQKAAVKKKKKVCLPLISSCFCFNQLKLVGVRGDIAHRIKRLNETLEEIAKEKQQYSLETTKVAQKQTRETISIVDESQVYGLDGPKNVLIEKLLSESSEGRPGGGKSVPVIIPIVGMGGIGKTTLAQLAFNDEKIKTHFSERMWACVSDPFDEIKVAKAIIESLKGSHQNLETLEALFQRIRESIEGKKFLLVLDDVWSDDRDKWEKFIQLLRLGAVGSRVLVTTRKVEVATMMGAAAEMITLQLLSDEYCWSIFSGLAFRGRNSEECKQLERVGRQIASKCKGLPLVAKSLGSLMCSKVTENEWEDVLSSRFWELKDEQTKTFAPFFLSYYDLSPRVRRCFSYCSLFPKDYNFDAAELIEMWMSQGYLSGSQNPEEEGKKCFQSLTMRSFFQDFRIDFDQTIIGCKMHDILHDFAQFLTRNECFTMRVEVDMEKTEPPSVEKIRHSWLALAPNFPKIPTSIFDQSSLRSLFIQCTSDTSLDDKNMVFFHQNFRYLKHLRTLGLISSKITKVPEQIGRLIHLRYLNLFQSRNLQELADEVCDLCNLQSLRIEGCSRLQRLPEGMGKLVNLRHLYMRGCKELVGLPKGIGGLTQLRTLDTMFIPKKNEAAYFLSLGDLKSLKHLRFQRYIFEITKCCNLINRSERELMYWECLVYLILNFGEADKKEEIRDEEDEFGILEALQPHPSLRGLLITEYKGTSLYPKWMKELKKLMGLHITNCKQCESLPPLGNLLPSLEDLVISGLDKVKKIGDEFLGLGVEQAEAVSFPKLKVLGFYNMRDWEDWEGTARTSLRSGVMPCLDVLIIENCGNLKSLPPFLKLTPLHTLCINSCGVLLQSLLNSEEELTKISHIPCIIIDGQRLC
ncbi:disease resistance protein RGA2-like [Ziziphus jujuba]|uniref:Disease resistance protein RGA2-like n=1 Tax=Ziziphus jujuba TaxID=326968 RepID=A0ABM3ICJ0_ZIZJJ|nr:disease resistance protein RGA2-like [Ziziphus jujuba]